MKIIVYSVSGHTWVFNDVKDINYHTKNLSFTYIGRWGEVKAEFHDAAGIVKIKNKR